MRFVVAMVLVGALGGVAVAGGAWDGTYTRDGGGGPELCPDAPSLTVTNNAFTLDWTIPHLAAQNFRVGKIAGTIGKSGAVVVKATIFSPLASQTQDALAQMQAKVSDLDTLAAEMKIQTQTGSRRIMLTTGFCSASWDGGASTEASTVDVAPTTKGKKGKKAKPAAIAKVKPTLVKPAPVAKTAPVVKPAPVAVAKPPPAAKPAYPPKGRMPTKAEIWANRTSDSTVPVPPAPPKPAPPPPKNLRNGDACEEDEDCASENCHFNQCFGAHGKPEYVKGSRCMHDEDCASGDCHDRCQ